MQQLAATGEAYFDIFSGPGRTLLAMPPASNRSGLSSVCDEDDRAAV